MPSSSGPSTSNRHGKPSLYLWRPSPLPSRHINPHEWRNLARETRETATPPPSSTESPRSDPYKNPRILSITEEQESSPEPPRRRQRLRRWRSGQEGRPPGRRPPEERARTALGAAATARPPPRAAPRRRLPARARRPRRQTGKGRRAPRAGARAGYEARRVVTGRPEQRLELAHFGAGGQHDARPVDGVISLWSRRRGRRRGRRSFQDDRGQLRRRRRARGGHVWG